MKFSFLAVLLLSAAAGSASTKSCFNNTAAINDAEARLPANVSEEREYVLCKDTLYNMGMAEVNPALVLKRPNVKVLCGHDGQRSNNCTFSGGGPHVIIRNLDNTFLWNVFVRGVTFQEASPDNFVVYASTELSTGLITFENCVFKKNDDVNAVVHISGEESMAFLFMNCTFEDNTAQNYMVGPEARALNFDGCEFRRNEGTLVTYQEKLGRGGYVRFHNSTIESNKAKEALVKFSGDMGLDTLRISHCLFMNNEAETVVNRTDMTTRENFSLRYTQFKNNKMTKALVAMELFGEGGSSPHPLSTYADENYTPCSGFAIAKIGACLVLPKKPTPAPTYSAPTYSPTTSAMPTEAPAQAPTPPSSSQHRVVSAFVLFGWTAAAVALVSFF